MEQFEELQELWQSQNAPPVAAFDARGFAEELRRFGRQQTVINLFKLALMAVAFGRLVTRIHWNPLTLCGGLLAYSALLLYLVLDWRNQIGISRLDFSAASVEFVHGAHERLQHQLNPMRRYFWLFVVGIGGGLNLMLWSIPKLPLTVRIADHLAAVALPFAAYVLGARIRRFRFRRECGAILERVENLLHTMEEQA
ncbi:MAG TPA: hypothetical protein VG456_08995 [Candidatus Sulfopaludibacter sp.]|jgi:hypothetical protein|nr:hypothetical protein [Candidatus Sulfopaludibacter sp.]